jgi:ankyrin repeat protein
MGSMGTVLRLILAAGLVLPVPARAQDAGRSDDAASSGTAMLDAIGHKDAAAVEEALRLGYSPIRPLKIGMTPLAAACACDCPVEILKILMHAGAGVNERSQVSERPAASEIGETPLTMAAFCAHSDRVKFLIDSGARIDEVTDHGYSVLMRAAQSHIDAQAKIHLLLQHGADVTHRAPDGETALSLAAGNNTCLSLAELLKAGALPHPRSPEGESCLMWAAATGNCLAVRQLLALGINVNARNADGNTALMCAAARSYYNRDGHLCVLRLLHRHGADVNAIDKDYLSVLDVAFRRVLDTELDMRVPRLLFSWGARSRIAGSMGVRLVKPQDLYKLIPPDPMP